MNYTLYEPSTGEIYSVITCADPVLLERELIGKSWIEGSFDSKLYYVENGQIVNKPANPSTHIVSYTFDYSSKTWIVNIEMTTIYARTHRNRLMSSIDRINPIWYSTLTDDQKNQLVQYRQALLDVPQQEGFPITINWPIHPDWM